MRRPVEMVEMVEAPPDKFVEISPGFNFLAITRK